VRMKLSMRSSSPVRSKGAVDIDPVREDREVGGREQQPGHRRVDGGRELVPRLGPGEETCELRRQRRALEGVGRVHGGAHEGDGLGTR
jgi:hypothetical protein